MRSFTFVTVLSVVVLLASFIADGGTPWPS
jgi:hypothetical protein